MVEVDLVIHLSDNMHTFIHLLWFVFAMRSFHGQLTFVNTLRLNE